MVHPEVVGLLEELATEETTKAPLAMVVEETMKGEVKEVLASTSLVCTDLKVEGYVLFTVDWAMILCVCCTHSIAVAVALPNQELMKTM